LPCPPERQTGFSRWATLPLSYDLLHRVRVDTLQQPLALLEPVGLSVQNGLSVLALAGLLLVHVPLLPVPPCVRVVVAWMDFGIYEDNRLF